MKKRMILLTFPGILALLLFVVFPMVQIIIPTLSGQGSFGSLYLNFLKDTYNQRIILRTLWISLLTTIIVLIIGVPLSLWIARMHHRIKKILILVILFPMLTNQIVLNFAWIILLGKNGIINHVLLSIHLISRPLSLLYNNTSIVIGSVYLFIPIMVVSLLGSLSHLNIEVEEAATVLGAHPSTTFFKIILPQISTDILTGVIWVFSWTMTSYTTPQLLGGNDDLVMSTLIYQQAMTVQNWTLASVISIVLIIISVGCILIIRSLIKLLDRRVAHA
ncbi:spermidine/putrescine ABC transporter permease [Philodulcilactobacillus myokoensis]|uniref:Spermidine/putrescine ABC transporter permease n=1 Tax=Philodulcilactobacillus myokoensis TaxID=2929573 RepID=A0A9W6ES49_9LACO|nr:ABC transporter permease [Philodulcilactobacillus myokoensis]GLB46460.1 spermidine/putrescine ABC transporter permease [Philodulcilactobacillus myokoensis]